jgi:hypothetical protein
MLQLRCIPALTINSGTAGSSLPITETTFSPRPTAHARIVCHPAPSRIGRCDLATIPSQGRFPVPQSPRTGNMNVASQIKEHMDVISSDRKTVGKVDHMEGTDKIKLTKQSSPDGQHHHFIPVSWVDHVDQHVHLNKSGQDVTSHWQHGRQ